MIYNGYLMMISGGFLKQGYPQSSSISSWVFPWNKPTIFYKHQAGELNIAMEDLLFIDQ